MQASSSTLQPPSQFFPLITSLITLFLVDERDILFLDSMIKLGYHSNKGKGIKSLFRAGNGSRFVRLGRLRGDSKGQMHCEALLLDTKSG